MRPTREQLDQLRGPARLEPSPDSALSLPLKREFRPEKGNDNSYGLRAALIATGLENDSYTRAARAMWEQACSGSVAAFHEIADRIDGKAVQRMEIDAESRYVIEEVRIPRARMLELRAMGPAGGIDVKSDPPHADPEGGYTDSETGGADPDGTERE